MFIVITTSATLFGPSPAYPHGLGGVGVGSAQQAASALAPLAGVHAQQLFAVGLVGASLLAAAVLPLSTAFVICEAFGAERSVQSSFTEAPLFFTLFIGILAIGAGIMLIPGVPIAGVAIGTQTLDGILLPIMLVFIIILANDRRLLGNRRNGRGLQRHRRGAGDGADAAHRGAGAHHHLPRAARGLAMHETRLTFLAAAAEARAILVLAEVEERWEEESALPGMTVGALAAHLARAVDHGARRTSATHVHGDVEPMSAAAYFAGHRHRRRQAPSSTSAIRARAAQGASQGGARCHRSVRQPASAHLRHALAAEPDDRLVEVLGRAGPAARRVPADAHPRADRAHRRPLRQHRPPRRRPCPAWPLTIALLVEVAELRHGEVAVLHALARRERDTVDALRVL